MSDSQDAGCVMLAELIRALIDGRDFLGYAAESIDYSVLETAFVVNGFDGLLGARPAKFRVKVERLDIQEASPRD